MQVSTRSWLWQGKSTLVHTFSVADWNVPTLFSVPKPVISASLTSFFVLSVEPSGAPDDIAHSRRGVLFWWGTFHSLHPWNSTPWRRGLKESDSTAAGLETERISQIRSNRRTKHLYVTWSTLPWAQYEAAIKTPNPKASAWLSPTWDHLENNPHGQTI